MPKIPELVNAAKKDGQEALALTDAGNLYGAINFYKECKGVKIKPIIGVDAYVAPRTRHDKEHGIDDHATRLVLLAKNEKGYLNLIRMVSRSYLEGFYHNPRLDRALMEEYAEGLVAILPSFAGEHIKAVKEGSAEKAEEAISWHKDVFGSNLFLELTHHPELAGHGERMREVMKMAKMSGVPIAAAHDIYYISREDALARELVVKIGTGEQLDREFGLRPENFSFITQKQAREYFKGIPEALENTALISDMCNLELELGKTVFPEFDVPSTSSHDLELRKLAEAGIAEKKLERTDEVASRLDYELSIISQKKLSTYFLVVADLLKYARSRDILTNTRGSAAGSLVSYLCGITTVDPLKFQLPFERFLNPERPFAPDIDMDIADNRRDELIDYARGKYGNDRVAQIGTFGTMLARAAVRDVARALGYSYGTGDKIAKLIPFPKQGFPVSIDKALESVSELKELYADSAEAKDILDLARKIEGNARHVGVHAAGVVITPGPLTDFVPVQYDPKGGKLITQYDMYSIADEYGGIGIIKFDFLGLKNLSILADSVERVEKRRGIKVDIESLPLDDKATYEMLSRGETLGVFQFSGSGITSYLVDLKPSEIHDLNAMVALYRPGPMAFIPEFIERKRNPSRITYLDPRMEPILNRTNGILIYQDDLLLLAVEMAGYTMAEADKLRKAVGKKKPAEMAAQKERFISGCVERDMSKDKAQKLWGQIETFAAYGFNKAHAVSYGNLAYQTAYMKAHFQVDYLAALLSADAGDVEKIAAIVAECKRMGIAVLPPDVNESFGDFTVVNDNTIRFGLYSIKNLGKGIADTIIEERNTNGHYKGVADLLKRVRDKNLNRKSLEALIQCGALDPLAERGRLIANIDILLSFHKESAGAPENQNSLFGTAESVGESLDLPPALPISPEQRLSWERELLGLYISGHPLDKHKEALSRRKLDIAATKERTEHGITTVVVGIVEDIQHILTKGGERMVFLRLADYSDHLEVVCFPRVVKDYVDLISPEKCVMVKGRLSMRKGEVSFVAEALKAL